MRRLSIPARLGIEWRMVDIGLYYYSYEGFTDRVMRAVEAELAVSGATAEHVYLERLVPTREKRRTGLAKYMWGGREALMGRRPHLQTIKREPTNGSVLVIAGPVWAFTYPPPIGSFIARYDLSSHPIAGILTHDGGPMRALDKLAQALQPARVIGTAALLNTGGDKPVELDSLRPLLESVVAEAMRR